MQEMVKCANCSAMVPPQKAFCSNCGAAMEEEEIRRENRGIENMAQTVIGMSLDQLGKTQMIPPTPKPEPKPAPPPVAPEPVAVAPPKLPTAPPVVEKTAGGSSKLPLIIIGVVVIGFALLVVLAAIVFYLMF